MPRLRSMAVIALLWVAAVAGASAPDGFGVHRRPEMPLIAGTSALATRVDATLDVSRNGRRWARLDASGKRWARLDERGKRWARLDVSGKRWG